MEIRSWAELDDWIESMIEQIRSTNYIIRDMRNGIMPKKKGENNMQWYCYVGIVLVLVAIVVALLART